MERDFKVKTVTIGFGRRSYFERRKPFFDALVVERRSGQDRRNGRDRRLEGGIPGMSVEHEKRVWLIKPVYKGNEK